MTEDLKGKTSEATKDLRAKLQQILISEAPPAIVNMVNFRRHLSEIEELEKWLIREKGNIEIPPRGNSLKDYLWDCHVKNGGKRLMCPRCSVMLNRRVQANFESALRERMEQPWRGGNLLLKVYPRSEESLVGFLVRCHNDNSEVALCLRYVAVYDELLARSFERVYLHMG